MKGCKANDGIMDNTRVASLAYRLDAEGDLLGLTRPNTLCDAGKYIPCNMISVAACDKWKPIAQPLVCDRAIVPTNMRPYTAAFKVLIKYKCL